MARARRAVFNVSDGWAKCPHCGGDINCEDFLEFDETMPGGLPSWIGVDADGFNRTWATLGHYYEPCPLCYLPLVVGSTDDGQLFVVAGRTLTDLKLLAMREGEVAP